MTFADGAQHWRDASKRLSANAMQSGLFADVDVWDLNRIKEELPDFWQQHNAILRKEVRGFGYWLWKPLIIKRSFNSLHSESDLIVYLDSGCTVNFNTIESRRRFDVYCKLARENGGLAFQLRDQPEAHWNKMDTVLRVSPNLVGLDSNQLVAGISILRNSSNTLDLIQKWLDVALEEKYRYIDDSISESTNFPGFRSHRHDQAIWSLLVKQSDFAILPDETFFGGNWDGEALGYPLWATRNSTGLNKPSNKFIYKLIRKLLRFLRKQD